MRKSDFQPEKLGNVLENSLKRLDLSGKLVEYGIWPIWNETVGPTIARNAQPERIRRGTLSVRVASPMWMQQLQYMKETISEKLNQRLGTEVVKNIFFSVGRLETSAGDSKNIKPSGNRHPSADAKLDEAHLQSVKDPEIRRALTRLFAACSGDTKP
jgi:predicted nucleic acid-binding Zn ribbon protein